MLSTFFLGFYENLKSVKESNPEFLFELIKSTENELSDLFKAQSLKAEVAIIIIDLVTYKLWGLTLVNFG